MQAASCDSFDWAKQWYAMAVAEDLDPGRPHSVELLGQPLVGARRITNLEVGQTRRAVQAVRAHRSRVNVPLKSFSECPWVGAVEGRRG
jgi:phenylpropionate dioxygenase-like ring-hydroxylating dioxygenase large terminal subunit